MIKDIVVENRHNELPLVEVRKAEEGSTVEVSLRREKLVIEVTVLAVLRDGSVMLRVMVRNGSDS